AGGRRRAQGHPASRRRLLHRRTKRRDHHARRAADPPRRWRVAAAIQGRRAAHVRRTRAADPRGHRVVRVRRLEPDAAVRDAAAGPWSVARLARAAGMSRSTFAARFKAQLGETPLDYLTRWRMYKAGTLLREGVLGIAEIASAVGYDSSGAFHRAFRRVHD